MPVSLSSGGDGLSIWIGKGERHNEKVGDELPYMWRENEARINPAGRQVGLSEMRL